MARTKTYIAGDWDHDQDAVEQLYKWNESKKMELIILRCTRANTSKRFKFELLNKTIVSCKNE